MTHTDITIEKVPGYKVGEQFLPTLGQAQRAALALLCNWEHDTGITSPEDFANEVMAHADAIVAILSPPRELRSRATRKDKGTRRGPKKPAAKPQATPATA